MKILSFVLHTLLTLIPLQCISLDSKSHNTYCGFELSKNEYDNLMTKSQQQGLTYDADKKWNIYDQINDSIRSAMPDSIEFEIFMVLLNKDEVGIDVYIPENEKHLETISCIIMNSNFYGKMPEQRYLFLYYYTSPNGGSVGPLEVASCRVLRK